MKKIHIRIQGRVRGVFFREGARAMAFEHGVFGWARHHEDGALHIVAEGEFADLKKFLLWCRRGPLPAIVKKIEFDFSSDLENFEDFVLS